MADQATLPGTETPEAKAAREAAEAVAGETPEQKAAREAAAPPKPGAAPARAAGVGKPKVTPPKGGTEIRISSSAFRERVDRDAAAKLKKALGMTLEEAQAIIKARKEGGEVPAVPAAGAAAPGSAAPARGPDPEKEKLRRQSADLERRLEAQRQKLKKVKTRERDRRTEIELRYSAVAAGIKADDADYAMGLYRSALRATPDGTDLPAPETFWPTLKATKPYLFADGAPAREVPLRPTTAPPLSRKPGEETPPVRAAGKPPGEKDVDALEKRDFDERTASRYGFRPPQSA